MNPHQLKRLFPHASKSVLAANSGDYGTGKPEDPHLAAGGGPAIAQPADVRPLDSVLPGQEAVEKRILVRITVRKCGILQDADNCAVKALVDQLRAIEAIPNDDPATIRLQVEQVRVKTKKEQGTEVEIIWP